MRKIGVVTDSVPQIESPGSSDFVPLFESMKEEGLEGVVCILSCNLCQSVTWVRA